MIAISRLPDSPAPTVRGRMLARNLRSLRKERRSRCWGRPGCGESPVLTLLHAGESEPFMACLGCGERLLESTTFRLVRETVA